MLDRNIPCTPALLKQLSPHALLIGAGFARPILEPKSDNKPIWRAAHCERCQCERRVRSPSRARWPVAGRSPQRSDRSWSARAPARRATAHRTTEGSCTSTSGCETSVRVGCEEGQLAASPPRQTAQAITSSSGPATVTSGHPRGLQGCGHPHKKARRRSRLDARTSKHPLATSSDNCQYPARSFIGLAIRGNEGLHDARALEHFIETVGS